MANPPVKELRDQIHLILNDADLTQTSSKKVRLLLEDHFDCDLTPRKREIDNMVMAYVNKKFPAVSDSEPENDISENEEEEAKPKRKSSSKRKNDDSDSEEEYKPKKTAKKSKKNSNSDSDSDADWKKEKKEKKTGTAKRAKGKGTGFTRPYQLSPDLASIVGADSMPRHEVVKKMWSIIKERNLYDPKNKQFAICDGELQKVFGVKRFRTFAMLKYLKSHFID